MTRADNADGDLVRILIMTSGLAGLDLKWVQAGCILALDGVKSAAGRRSGRALLQPSSGRDVTDRVDAYF
jgi:hypothetical protein